MKEGLHELFGILITVLNISLITSGRDLSITLPESPVFPVTNDRPVDQVTLTPQPLENVEYNVTEIAVNQLGSSKGSTQEAVVYSGKTLKAPTNFEVVELKNSTCALLRWDPASPEDLRGNFKGYKLQTRPVEGREPTREFLLAPNVNEFYLTDLKPFAKHSVWIFAYNSSDNGPSADLTFDTTNEPPSTVENLRAQVLGRSAILLKWEKPLKSNGLTGYRINYAKIIRSEVGVPNEFFVSNPLLTVANLNELLPDTKYRITVTAVNSFGEGQGFFLEAKTEPHSSSHKPTKPNFSLVPLTSLKITWQPSNDPYPGENFFVKYREKGDRKWKQTYETFYENFLTTDLLERNTTYDFLVVSVSEYNKAESETQEIEIK